MQSFRIDGVGLDTADTVEDDGTVTTFDWKSKFPFLQQARIQSLDVAKQQRGLPVKMELVPT